jgi:hypothetical protein
MQEIVGTTCDLGNVMATEQVTTFYRRRVVPRRVLRTSNGVVQRALRRLRLLR